MKKRPSSSSSSFFLLKRSWRRRCCCCWWACVFILHSITSLPFTFSFTRRLYVFIPKNFVRGKNKIKTRRKLPRLPLAFFSVIITRLVALFYSLPLEPPTTHTHTYRKEQIDSLLLLLSILFLFLWILFSYLSYRSQEKKKQDSNCDIFFSTGLVVGNVGSLTIALMTSLTLRWNIYWYFPRPVKQPAQLLRYCCCCCCCCEKSTTNSPVDFLCSLLIRSFSLEILLVIF